MERYSFLAAIILYKKKAAKRKTTVFDAIKITMLISFQLAVRKLFSHNYWLCAIMAGYVPIWVISRHSMACMVR